MEADLISKEAFFWGVYALWVVLMVSQAIDFWRNPEDRIASGGTMAVSTIMMFALIAALPHI